jgi:copper chaperone CopZ
MGESRDRINLAGGSAVVAAGLASICCILPLGLGVLGLSGAMISAFFEPLRPYMLALAGLLLALGFYLSFRAGKTREVCSTDSMTASRAARPTLFIAVAATVGLALFPSMVSLASGGQETLPAEVESKVVLLQVVGMTCETCASQVRTQLLDLPGVIDVAVSYERGVAAVRVREERGPEVHSLIEAVEQAGFTATVVER